MEYNLQQLEIELYNFLMRIYLSHDGVISSHPVTNFAGHGLVLDVTGDGEILISVRKFKDLANKKHGYHYVEIGIRGMDEVWETTRFDPSNMDKDIFERLMMDVEEDLRVHTSLSREEYILAWRNM